MAPPPPMTAKPSPTCDDCFFRKAELCALAGSTPCPTFRPTRKGTLVRPLQAPLVARPGHAAG
jgi:hypothetical protein